MLPPRSSCSGLVLSREISSILLAVFCALRASSIAYLTSHPTECPREDFVSSCPSLSICLSVLLLVPASGASVRERTSELLSNHLDCRTTMCVPRRKPPFVCARLCVLELCDTIPRTQFLSTGRVDCCVLFLFLLILYPQYFRLICAKPSAAFCFVRPTSHLSRLI